MRCGEETGTSARLDAIPPAAPHPGALLARPEPRTSAGGQAPLVSAITVQRDPAGTAGPILSDPRTLPAMPQKQQLPPLEVAGKQGIRHFAGRSLSWSNAGPCVPFRRSLMSTPLDETGWCYTLQHVSSIDAALPLAIWLRDSCPCIYCGVDMLQSRQHISNLQHREHLLPACDYPIRQGVRHQHQRRRTIPPVARGE